jgi:hypothetical protein
MVNASRPWRATGLSNPLSDQHLADARADDVDQHDGQHVNEWKPAVSKSASQMRVMVDGPNRSAPIVDSFPPSRRCEIVANVFDVGPRTNMVAGTSPTPVLEIAATRASAAT